MIRVGHIADVHLGKRPYHLEEREQDIYSAFEEAVEALSARHIDVLLLSGDIFDTSHPPIRALRVFRDVITPLVDEGVRVYAISGDHDTPKRRDVPPISLFDTMGVTYLWSRSPCAEADGLRVCGLQNHPRSRIRELLSKLGEIRLEGEYNILMLHQGVKPYFSYGEVEVQRLPRGFTYYALGHVHAYMVKRLGGSPLVYPGSLEVIDVSEVNDLVQGRKGPVLVTLDNGRASVEKIALRNLRPQIVLRGVDGGYRELSEAVLAEVERCKREGSPKKPLVHIYLEELPPQKVKEIVIEKLKDEVLDIIFHRAPRRDEEPVGPIDEGGIEIREILARLLGEGEILDLAEELLERLGRAEDVDSAYRIVEDYYRRVTANARGRGKAA